MTRLLSDEELDDKLFDLIGLASMQGFEQANSDNSSGKKLDVAIKEYQKLINTQKRLYADSITKKLHIDNWTDVGSKVAFKNEVMTYSKASMFRKGWNAALEELRVEQRARIK